MFLLVDSGEDFETRVPLPAIFVMGLVEVDVEVDPLPLRRDFEFLVALDIGEIGANESFSYVPVPKLVGFFVSVWIRFEMELLVRASEKEVEIVIRPAGTDFGSKSRHWVAKRVFLDEDGTGTAPERGSAIEGQRTVLLGVDDLRCVWLLAKRGDDA